MNFGHVLVGELRTMRDVLPRWKFKACEALPTNTFHGHLSISTLQDIFLSISIPTYIIYSSIYVRRQDREEQEGPHSLHGGCRGVDGAPMTPT